MPSERYSVSIDCDVRRNIFPQKMKTIIKLPPNHFAWRLESWCQPTGISMNFPNQRQRWKAKEANRRCAGINPGDSDRGIT